MVVKRFRFSDEQKAVLERVYSSAPFPDLEKKEQLARRLGTPADSVDGWFRRRRYKERNEGGGGGRGRSSMNGEEDDEEEGGEQDSNEGEDRDDQQDNNVGAALAAFDENASLHGDDLHEWVVEMLLEGGGDNAATARMQASKLYILMQKAQSVEDKESILQGLMESMSPLFARTASENKQLLGRLRNWMVGAVKDRSEMLILSILRAMNGLSISLSLLAELKFGKVLLLVEKKFAQEDIQDICIAWHSRAEEALALERVNEEKAASEKESEIPRKRPKLDTATNVRDSAGKGGGDVDARRPSSPLPSASNKPLENKVAVNKGKVGMTVNTGFFKALSQPSSKAAGSASSSKPPVAAAVVPVKRSVKPEPTKSGGHQGISHVLGNLFNEPKSEATPVVQSIPQQPATTHEAPRGVKRKKSVRWKSDEQLFAVKYVENIANKYAEDLFITPPSTVGDARDLDRQEGKQVFHKDDPEFDEDGEVEWAEPMAIDFSYLKDIKPAVKWQKRGGEDPADSEDALRQDHLEHTVLMVHYPVLEDIPPSPNEPKPLSEHYKSPKAIPLPKEFQHLQIRHTKPKTEAKPVVKVREEVQHVEPPPPLPVHNPPPTVYAPNPTSYPMAQMNPMMNPMGMMPGYGMPYMNGSSMGADMYYYMLQASAMPNMANMYQPPPPQTMPMTPTIQDHSHDGKNVQMPKVSHTEDVRDFVRNLTADQLAALPPNKYKIACRFYPVGDCNRGDACDYVHVRK